MATGNRNNFEGVVVYTIGRDHCLTGVYCNNHRSTAHAVYNEIARISRLDDDIEDPSDLSGEYVCQWIDVGNSTHTGKLFIRRTQVAFDVRWEENNNVVFIGTGFLTTDTQFVVAYTTP